MNIEHSGHISHLSLTVVKSTHRLEVVQARMTPAGLETIDGRLKDHEYMLVDAVVNSEGVHEFVHARQRGMQAMTQIIPQYENGALSVSWQGEDAVELPLDEVNGPLMLVKIWDDICVAVDQGEMLADWFTNRLGRPVRLVRAVGESFHRLAGQSYVPNDNPMRWQDGYPIHWFPQEDVDELEEIAGMPGNLGWERFRPQIVAAGFAPQALHEILELTIAGIPCDQPKPCSRCPMTQSNAETGVKTTEPLKTLSTYKTWKNRQNQLDIIFGENINPHGEGIISQGDLIQGKSKRPNPLVYGSLEVMRKLAKLQNTRE